MDNQTNPLASLEPVSMWLTDGCQAVFPSPRTWEFFKTAHKAELVKSGALLLGSGRRSDYVDTAIVGHVVKEILYKESMARLEASRAEAETA